MRKKGLVYRMTMVLGLLVIGTQAGGELVYSKFVKKDREAELKQVTYYACMHVHLNYSY